jgi:hypothetical protein
MSVIINGTTGVTFDDSSLQGAAASPFGLKNRIINGDMVINQRGFTGAVGTYTYTLDRWVSSNNTSSKYTISQSSIAPTGFSNSLLVTSSAATTVGSSDYYTISQNIEGFNFADLGFGTANAQTVTLSFWVRSSLTGTFGGSIGNYSVTRSYPFNYTISSANTWTKITVTIPGDTSGTWTGATNAGAANVLFGLGVGSTYSGTANAWTGSTIFVPTGSQSVVGTNGATWYVTGVQLERNTTATPFEWLPYSTELALCQRYYEVISFGAFRGITCQARGANDTNGWCSFKVTKRASPTMSTSGTFGAWTSTSTTNGATLNFSGTTVDGSGLDVVTSGMSAGNASLLVANTSASIIASIEL